MRVLPKVTDMKPTRALCNLFEQLKADFTRSSQRKAKNKTNVKHAALEALFEKCVSLGNAKSLFVNDPKAKANADQARGCL